MTHDDTHPSGELAAVCAALARAEATGEAAVLATVVRVDGSAYRRPGARMVIDGVRTVGLVSGGCLEADLAERAAGVLAAGAAAVVVYDTAGSDDAVWSLGLGCDGAVHVLLEPLAGERLAVVRALHDRWRHGSQPIGVATVIGVNREGVTQDRQRSQWTPAVGDRFAFELSGYDNPDHEVARAVPGTDSGLRDGSEAWPAEVVAAAAQVAAAGGPPARCTVALDDGEAELFIETLTPPPTLLVCGGGPDAQPVVAFAAALGWRVTVVDHRPGFVQAARFPGAAAVRHVPRGAPLGDALGDALGDVAALGGYTAAVVMSHDYVRDLDYLDALVAAGAGYVGVLGPARRRARLWADVCARRGWPADRPAPPSVHGPAGLDLGGDGPAAIALAIVAEVAAVRHGRGAGALRERAAGIHDDGADRSVGARPALVAQTA